MQEPGSQGWSLPSPSPTLAALRGIYLLARVVAPTPELPLPSTLVQAQTRGSLSGSSRGPSSKEPTLPGASLREGLELGGGEMRDPAPAVGVSRLERESRSRCPYSQTSAFHCF